MRGESKSCPDWACDMDVLCFFGVVAPNPPTPHNWRWWHSFLWCGFYIVPLFRAVLGQKIVIWLGKFYVCQGKSGDFKILWLWQPWHLQEDINILYHMNPWCNLSTVWMITIFCYILKYFKSDIRISKWFLQVNFSESCFHPFPFLVQTQVRKCGVMFNLCDLFIP